MLGYVFTRAGFSSVGLFTGPSIFHCDHNCFVHRVSSYMWVTAKQHASDDRANQTLSRMLMKNAEKTSQSSGHPFAEICLNRHIALFNTKLNYGVAVTVIVGDTWPEAILPTTVGWRASQATSGHVQIEWYFTETQLKTHQIVVSNNVARCSPWYWQPGLPRVFHSIEHVLNIIE